jgi:radical SAM family uncharacterized protein/radical SAM-linked protein
MSDLASSADQVSASRAQEEARSRALSTHPYAEFLPQVTKPGRYLGGEEQAIIKEHEGMTCRFVLAFPDLYEIGMSHLGTRIIYDLINKHEDLVCERSFSPWPDMEEQLRARGLPLVSLETYRPLSDFDVVGVSLQYELSYTNVLLNLELGGVPLLASERGDDDPIVIAGGPTCTHPEPMAIFLDLVLVGEAEEVLTSVLRTVGSMRAEKRPRAEILAACAKLPGIYVPSFYEVEVEERTGMQVVVGLSPEGLAAGAAERVERVFVRDLDEFPFPTRFPVPYAEAIFDRTSVEITRGCTEGCRFCQAGMIYRPVRERKPEDIIEAVLEGTDAAGFDETSLTALSTADVSCIDPLIKQLVPKLAERKVSLGIASLRAYGLNEEMLDEIQRVGIDGLTFAPEAGSQRMRDVINKNVSDEDILTSARRLFERGMDRMKLYFIMGLPTETEEDVLGMLETGQGILNLAREMQLDRPPKVTVSVSQHVPKPHTPFQWAAMDTMEQLDGKVRLLKERVRKTKLNLKTHEVRDSWLECIFARGDRRLGQVILTAYRKGARFDGWREVFSFQRWLDALEEHAIEPDVYTRTLPVGVPLPWTHLDMGMEPGFLESEYKKAVASRVSPPCGKPAGAQVHHRTLDEAHAEKKRLVCYDCGVACDLSMMRDERIEALQSLQVIHERRKVDEAALVPTTALTSRIQEKIKGHLSTSNLKDNSAFKENAEAPYSRVRIFFSKRDTASFLSHLDLVRIFPRMFRRAKLEMGLRRGYNPQPRMTFGPALALGMSAEEEVLDVDLLLERSAQDMAGELSEEERESIAQELFLRLRNSAPPGVHIEGLRLLRGGEKKLGELVAAAEYAVSLEGAQLEGLDSRLRNLLGGEELIVERMRKKKRKKQKRGRRRRDEGPLEELIQVDLLPILSEVAVDDVRGELRFRIRTDSPTAGARPREVAAALVGEVVGDHRMRRLGLLADVDGSLDRLGRLGPVYRSVDRLIGDPSAAALRKRLLSERN